MKKRRISFALVCVLMISLLSGCGKDDKDKDTVGNVYYLNFKPEVSEYWESIAEIYQQETGISVKVVTAASNTYESTLMSEMDKSAAPTLFQINGPVGYQNWKDYCMDLSETNLYKWLLDKSLAISDGDNVYGIPYVVEGYGIIYNQEIMDRYFALDGAVITDINEVTNFETLRAMVMDMQARKNEVGIEGVFASTSLLPGEDWRWQTHLANIPIYYEFMDKDVVDADELDFSYSDNFKQIFDLYLNNSCTEPALLGSKTVGDSMAEFALGKVAMVQNGNWAWSQIDGVKGNIVKAENVKFLPIYTGVDGEEKQGLCTGTENFFCVNSKASEADRKATIDFLEWLFSSEGGKYAITEDFGFIAPFSTFGEADKPVDPLAQEVLRYMEDSSLTSVPWNFTVFPSQTFKDNFGAALLEYASGTMDWNKVVSTFISEWKNEKWINR